MAAGAQLESVLCPSKVPGAGAVSAWEALSIPELGWHVPAAVCKG